LISNEQINGKIFIDNQYNIAYLILGNDIAHPKYVCLGDPDNVDPTKLKASNNFYILANTYVVADNAFEGNNDLYEIYIIDIYLINIFGSNIFKNCSNLVRCYLLDNDFPPANIGTGIFDSTPVYFKLLLPYWIDETYTSA
jgi:hypothetical protein